MKLFTKTILSFSFLLLFYNGGAQVLEWRLANGTYNPADPDAGGPATGSVTFTLQIHTAAGTLNNVTGISTGWSYQSALAMVPTGAPCGTNSVAQPANISMSGLFSGLGFTYNNVNECSGSVNFSTGGYTFDRRSVGTVDGGTINLTTTWVDMFTVTLWALGASNPQAGHVVINSGSGGTPGAFNTYAVSDDVANEYVANSLTYASPLSLGSVVPVLFSDFDVKCVENGTYISWSTSTESNSSYFTVEKSTNALDWKAIGNIPAAGNSHSNRNYHILYPDGGNMLYRIKQVDLDGRSIQTNIERANCEPKSIKVLAYPIPTRDVLQVLVKSTVEAQTNLALFDAAGKQVRVVEDRLHIGTNNFRMMMTGLPAGNYLLKVSQEGELIETIQVRKD